MVFMNRPLVLRQMRLEKEEAIANSKTIFYKRLHWLYFLYIYDIVDQLKMKYLRYRLSKIKNFHLEKRWRSVQSLTRSLFNKTKHGISQFRTLYALKNTLMVFTANMQSNAKESCTNIVAQLLHKMGVNLRIENNFLQYMLDIKNVQRRFKNNYRKTMRITHYTRSTWEQEILSFKKWETARAKNRAKSKLTKDTFSVKDHVDNINPMCKEFVIRYLIRQESIKHVLAKLQSGFIFKARLIKMNQLKIIE